MENSPENFTVLKDSLRRAAPVKSLRATDGRYDVRIMYYGDYAGDLDSGRLSRDNLVLSARPLGGFPDLVLMAGHVMLRPDFSFLSVGDVPRAVLSLQAAMESGQALERLLDRYFPI